MKIFVSYFSQLLLLLSPTAYGSAKSSTSPTPQPSAVGKVVSVTGTVRIRRNGRNPINAGRNVPLFQGDQILVASASAAKILCLQGFQQFELPPGEHNISCLAGQGGDSFTAILNKGRPEVASIRGPNGNIIVPRANDYPAILVRIINSRPETSSTSISLKRLLPNDRRSSLLNEIRSLPITSDAKRLLLADVYSLNKLYGRAIEELRGVSDATNDPFIQINLGDLYLASNLAGEAKRAYSSAIQAAVATNDSLGEAIAQHALGIVYKYEGGRVSEASEALTRAIQLYRDLGEAQIADQLQQELPVLPSNSPDSRR